MTYLAVAIALIFFSDAVALLVIKSVDISQYVDVMSICYVLGEAAEQCTPPAIYAGSVGCLSAAILLVLLILTNRRFPSRTMTAKVGGHVFVAIAPLVIVIVGFNLWVELNTPWPIYRVEIFSSHSAARAAALSLSNLIWPLCLQLANNAITTKWRVLILCLLAPIVAESPFRGVILAVIIFGMAIRAIEQAIGQIRLRGFASRPAAVYGSIVLIGIASMTALLVIETQQRTTNLKMVGGVMSQTIEKLGQRVAIPLYQ